MRRRAIPAIGLGYADQSLSIGDTQLDMATAKTDEGVDPGRQRVVADDQLDDGIEASCAQAFAVGRLTAKDLRALTPETDLVLHQLPSGQ
jgi:hypothetical protein